MEEDTKQKAKNIVTLAKKRIELLRDLSSLEEYKVKLEKLREKNGKSGKV